ncbi:cytochrome b5-like [Pollicipes pollicipes]|uniref:cytochrome b5-like n=1 Tax=Pollicipes pollicipes TaxID=41117 RepID=UPI0018858698|nr:cytochrome b5-like [Pollicipes pollicipes]
MTQGMADSVGERSSTKQVLQMAVSTLDTLSTLLGLTVLSEPARPRAAGAPAPVFTLDQVAEHCWRDDCWVVLYDRVYDVTRFLGLHPGGADILLENAGRDATSAFHGVGHSPAAADAMRPYQVGLLAAHQCMWTK